MKPGGIILVHDGVEHTVRAIPGIVEGLRKRGMCPGFLATTQRSVRGANGIPFHVIGGEAVIAPAFVAPREPQHYGAPHATSPRPGAGGSTC